MELKKVKGKPPVIMQILPNLKSGGVERGTVDASKAIVKAGGISYVVSNSKMGSPLVDEVLRSKGNHINLPVHSKNIFTMIKNIKKIRNLIKELEVDIVNVRSRAPAWSTYFAIKKTDAKLVTTFHGAYGCNNKFKRFYNSIMTKGDRVVAISKYIKKYVTDNYKMDGKKVNIVIRGIDIDRFDPKNIKQEKIQTLTNEWNIPDGAPIILSTGRITRIKGLDTLVEAAKILKEKRYTDLCYVLLGADNNKDAYHKELLEKIESYGLSSNFRFVGFCSDTPTAYMMSNLTFNLTVVPEGAGRSVLESQAMGRPVVSTNTGGLLETVNDGVSGTFVKPFDAKATAEAMEKYLNLTSKEKDLITKEGAKFVRENFTTEIMYNQLFKIYNELL